jgi:protein-L-isoaspartate(D-aspartate) O-methyltransferase
VAIAYADFLVPLGNGRELNSPMALGRMLTEAAPRRGRARARDRRATGYAAAVLAAGRLGGRGRGGCGAGRLSRASALADTGVKLVEGPLTEGMPPGAPYDLILIDGAVEFVPER